MNSTVKEHRPRLLHVVGGGFNQVPLVERAQSMGMRVLVTDMADDPPARHLADAYQRVDTTDRDGTLAAARRHGIDLITTDQTDVAVPTVAYVAERMGLAGIGYECALRFTNKDRMRQALRPALGRHLPASHFFDSPAAAVGFCAKLTVPGDYLVKPVDSQGSKGVRVLEANFEPIVMGAFEQGGGAGILVERFIRGDEYSVEGFVREGLVTHLTVTRKYAYPHNPCLEQRHTYFGDIARDVEQRLIALNAAIIETLGLPFGNTHAEFKVDASGQIYLMEVAARGAGAGISSHVIPYLTGFDPLQAILSCLLGTRYAPALREYTQRYAVVHFFDLPPGKIASIDIDRHATDDLLAFRFDASPGETLHRPRDSRDRPGYIIVGGLDREDVLQRERRALSAVQITYA